jgi:hypothetical protein
LAFVAAFFFAAASNSSQAMWARPGAVPQIKLIVGLHWNAAGGPPLNGLGDRVGISEVVLFGLARNGLA